MSVQTVLLDFTIDPARFFDDCSIKESKKLLTEGLKTFFPDLISIHDIVTADGYLFLYTEKNIIFINIRFFNHGLLTINIEYYKGDEEQQRITFELTRKITQKLETLIDCNGHSNPALQRSGLFRYYPTSDERILEYDVDKVLFDKRSPFQKVQIVHTKSLGNMLVLDELQNISEADLIYTETLMQRGIENYQDKEICILGGGDGALLYELLKENPKFVTMLEIDEMVMKACNEHMKSICGDVLEQRKTDQYEIIVDDCMVYLNKYIKAGRKFDYLFGDLTDIPITDTPTGEIWNFIRTILEKSVNLLKPNGVFLTHGNGVSCAESLKMFEYQLNALKPNVKFTKTKAFIPSFMEEWVFYQVRLTE